ncbi:hypothetical protein [Burkholderia multivorans]|uniref:hypothetical protein n=1 Tax=Burkholderia multivorans TaxID=87883 RepID=UPI0019D15B1D|nr:hypothetical protein [Burkholderia multivorans]MBN7130650.1 hypothetical protein [Burkholderia multivorans]MBN8173357.1 hypothetical protein [Burkholderia multivorans]QSL29507.1 hypothetical protein G0D92_30340 [Burkholderia multivorans]
MITIAEIRTVFRYRVKSTGQSSMLYGACEVCNQHVSEVFVLTGAMLYQRKDGDFRWTGYHCVTVFGHAECVKSMRIGAPLLALSDDTSAPKFRAEVSDRTVLINRDIDGFKVYVDGVYQAQRRDLRSAVDFVHCAVTEPEQRRPFTAR